MSLHPLDPEIVAATDSWFYSSHPRGRELRGPDGNRSLHPTSAEDAAGRQAWIEEYRRRLEEKRESDHESNRGGNDLDDTPEPLEPCNGCCPTDFEVEPNRVVLEAEDSVILQVEDSQAAGHGRGTYTWTTNSQNLSLVDDVSSQGVITGRTATVVAGAVPSQLPGLGEMVEVSRSQSGCPSITKQVWFFIRNCIPYRLAQPRIVAIATDSYLTPMIPFIDPSLPSVHILFFGQDSISSTTGRLPSGHPSVGASVSELEPKMRELLSEFASNDTSGMATRLFNDFLHPQTALQLWSDSDLTSAAQSHPNINSWVHRALSAPTSPERSAGRTRIHQSLRNAGWDINAAIAPTDLGVPAFNRGTDWRGTEDFGNGLAVMINGVQHVVVVAKEYYYNRCKGYYYIRLEYVFYDVFGLDDEDLREYGADGWPDSDAAEGISAWWQLQHQHGYSPLITRIAFEREFKIPAL